MAYRSVITYLVVITAFLFVDKAYAQDNEPVTISESLVIKQAQSSDSVRSKPDNINYQTVQTIVEEVTSVKTYYTDGSVEERILAQGESVDTSGRIINTQETDEFDESKLKGIARGFSHFVWGLETGMLIDLSGLDMSTFNLDVMFGYRNKFIQTLGVGGGIHKSLGSADSFLPVYVLFRSSFRTKPSLCFFHLRIGYSFNTISNSPTFGDTSCAIGCGINLTRKRKFQSYLLLAYAFRHFNQKHTEMTALRRSNVSLAQLGFGMTF